MKYHDILLVRTGSSLQAFIPPAGSSSATETRPMLAIFGSTFEDCGSCCEWLEVRDKKGGQLVGICLTDFYESSKVKTIAGLVVDNTIWQGSDAIILLIHAKEWQIQAGPYLPVTLFVSQQGEHAYLIPDGISTGESLKGGLAELPVNKN
jgi:hypothetical protein